MANIEIKIEQFFDESSISDIASSIEAHIKAGDILILTSSNGDQLTISDEEDWNNYKRGRSLSDVAKSFLITRCGLSDEDFKVDIDKVSKGNNESQELNVKFSSGSSALFKQITHRTFLREGWYGVSLRTSKTIGQTIWTDLTSFIDDQGHDDTIILKDGGWSSLYFGLIDLILKFDAGDFEIHLTFKLKP